MSTLVGKSALAEVTTEDRAVDMIEEGFDLVIRMNPAPDESLVGRAILRGRLVVGKRRLEGTRISA